MLSSLPDSALSIRRFMALRTLNFNKIGDALPAQLTRLSGLAVQESKAPVKFDIFNG
jgi:hypothetical protein